MQETQNVEMRTEDVMHGKYLVFQVGDASYGIEIKYVTEIVGVQDITAVPHTHTYVKGITNLRGTIVPVVDVGLRFGYAEKEYTDRTCIIVLSLDNMSIGLIVDEVNEDIFIDDDNIKDPPYLENEGTSSDFVKNIGIVNEEVKQLLDIHKIFEEGDLT